MARIDNLVRFTYIRDRRRNPIGGVAFTISADHKGNPVLKIGASFCSDEDTFVKAEAWKFAKERLEKNPVVKLIDPEASLTQVMYDALSTATTDFNDPNAAMNPAVLSVPSWIGSSQRAGSAVRRMRKTRGL